LTTVVTMLVLIAGVITVPLRRTLRLQRYVRRRITVHQVTLSSEPVDVGDSDRTVTGLCAATVGRQAPCLASVRLAAFPLPPAPFVRRVVRRLKIPPPSGDDPFPSL
jgi:hypothetical protein